MFIFNSNFIQSFGLVLGGIALFIYGIDQMSDGLKSIAGSKIRYYIEKYTKNLFMAVTVGTIITALLNSSTAVTVISISLVRAGLMRLEQAIGITIGANIGTCATSIMIGLNIEQFAYYLIFLGIILIFLAKKKVLLYLGKTLFGFGLLFAGLEIMSSQLVLIADQSWFTDVMLILGKYPWLALLGGTVATAVLQSSAAVIGIVQKLYVTGAIAPAAGAAFIFGANVGTCLTAIVAGTGGSVSTRRAAWFHAVYNIVGALIGMLILSPFLMFTDYLNNFLHGSPEMWIAQAHLIFNIGSTILIFPFVNQSVKLLKFLIPGDEDQGTKIESIDELDDSLVVQFPGAALEVTRKNTLRMGNNVLTNLNLTKENLFSKSMDDYAGINEIETVINSYDKALTGYLAKIARQKNLSSDQMDDYFRNFEIIKNYERISDICINVSNFYKLAFDEGEDFLIEEKEELAKLYDCLILMFKATYSCFEKEDNSKVLLSIIDMENTVNNLEIKYREKHFGRMCSEMSNAQITASIYVDILSYMERIGDHILKIANNIVCDIESNHVFVLDNL